jgi:flagellar biosynthesis protein FlhF
LGLFGKEGVQVNGYVAEEPARTRSAPSTPSSPEEFNRVKDKVIQAARGQGRATDLDTVMKKLTDIQSQLSVSGGSAQREEDSVRRVRTLLVANEFSPELIAALLEEAKTTLTVDQLNDEAVLSDFVVEAIGRRIGILDDARVDGTSPLVLVGPTGVGKTTTIAKLAALYGVRWRDGTWKRVRIITIDNYRIGARQQIETYGEIMEIPVVTVERREELRRELDAADPDELVLVDTIGKSPRDYGQIGRMRALLEAAGRRASVHLALSATTKYSDLDDILRQFEPFNYRSVVITKLDETGRIGSLVSALWKARKPASFMTDGQRVPQDLERASVLRFLLYLEGFRLRRPKLEEMFGPVRSEYDNDERTE